MTIINLHSIPRDTLDHTLDFLSGWDLLALGCVNKALCREIDRDPRVWHQRILANEDSDATDSPKQQYIRAQSLHLNGGDHTNAIPLPSDTAAKWQSEAFSIDAWFCMLPSTTDAPSGGIILGAQSQVSTTNEKQVPGRPEFHQQLIHVDPMGNLYCSVTKNKPIVKTKLQLERWYHIALTYSRGMQCVYLDGALVHVALGEPLHVEWGKMKDLQFGTGYMTYGSKGRPTDTFVGWYGFNGLLDVHRVWGHALSMGDVQDLARGERSTGTAVPSWSHKPTEQQLTMLVHCTRPREHYYVRAAFL